MSAQLEKETDSKKREEFWLALFTLISVRLSNRRGRRAEKEKTKRRMKEVIIPFKHSWTGSECFGSTAWSKAEFYCICITQALTRLSSILMSDSNSSSPSLHLC